MRLHIPHHFPFLQLAAAPEHFMYFKPRACRCMSPMFWLSSFYRKIAAKYRHTRSQIGFTLYLLQFPFDGGQDRIPNIDQYVLDLSLFFNLSQALAISHRNQEDAKNNSLLLKWTTLSQAIIGMSSNTAGGFFGKPIKEFVRINTPRISIPPALTCYHRVQRYKSIAASKMTAEYGSIHTGLSASRKGTPISPKMSPYLLKSTDLRSEYVSSTRYHMRYERYADAGRGLESAPEQHTDNPTGIDAPPGFSKGRVASFEFLRSPTRLASTSTTAPIFLNPQKLKSSVPARGKRELISLEHNTSLHDLHSKIKQPPLSKRDTVSHREIKQSEGVTRGVMNQFYTGLTAATSFRRKGYPSINRAAKSRGFMESVPMSHLNMVNPYHHRDSSGIGTYQIPANLYHIKESTRPSAGKYMPRPSTESLQSRPATTPTIRRRVTTHTDKAGIDARQTPQADLNCLADRVYKRIVDRIKRERELRGR